MDFRLILAYFVVGGSVISLVTYYGAQGKGLTAAFIANMPTITLLTFLTIYLSAGEDSTVSYAKGLMMMLPPWVLYILSVIYMTPRVGFPLSLLLGVLLYLLASLVVMRLF